MISMALLVIVWTVSCSLMAGWFENLRMPDAFVFAMPSLSNEQWQAIQKVDAATQSCVASAFPVWTVDMQLGVKGITSPRTLFIGADMASFVRMTQLEWYGGDAKTALRRLEGGRALLVSREWSVAHGLGVGSRLPLETLNGTVEFEVAGVVASPGLDLATHALRMGGPFSDVSVSSVFGTREDALSYFGVESPNLALLSLREDTSDEEAVRQLTEAAPQCKVVTSRKIRVSVQGALDRLRAIGSAVAIGTLLLGCLAVGNLIVAEVAMRRFEFGVLLAIGASRGLLGRLVAGQTLIVALVGCLAGTLLGIQHAMVVRGLHEHLVGIEYPLSVPLDVIAVGVVVVLAAALVAALPTIWSLMRRPPRPACTASSSGGPVVTTRYYCGWDKQHSKWSEARGTARFIGSKDVASSKVTFFWPFYGGYHVIALDAEGYNYAMVTSSSRDLPLDPGPPETPRPYSPEKPCRPGQGMGF